MSAVRSRPRAPLKKPLKRAVFLWLLGRLGSAELALSGTGPALKPRLSRYRLKNGSAQPSFQRCCRQKQPEQRLFLLSHPSSHQKAAQWSGFLWLLGRSGSAELALSGTGPALKPRLSRNRLENGSAKNIINKKIL